MNSFKGGRNVEVRYDGFPTDDQFYWLRWIDKVDVLGNGTEFPTIQAHLSPLDERKEGWQLPGVDAVAAKADRLGPIAVHASSLPAFRLGSVFRNGKVVGSLGMETRSLIFDRATSKSIQAQCDSESSSPRPGWWSTEFPIIPRKVYALGGLSKANCLVLQNSTSQLIFPASEIFRVFCAPEPKMAERLLSGPWELARDRIINESWTEKHDACWEIGLRRGLTANSVLPAAAFEFTLYGRRVAAAIIKRFSGRPAGLINLFADIPYDWETIEFDFEGLAFPDKYKENLDYNRFLCLRITGVRFPKLPAGLPPELIYRLDNYNTFRETVDPSLEVAGFIPHHDAPLPNETDGTITVTANEAASMSLNILSTSLDITSLIGGPLVQRMELVEPVETATERKGTTPGDPFENASSTSQTPGSAGAAPLTYDEAKSPSPSNFREVVGALDELLASGAIKSWRPIEPADDKFDIRDGFPVWLFPWQIDGERKPWVYSLSSQRRSALVAQVNINGRVLYLVEIERLPRRKRKVQPPTEEAFTMLFINADEIALQAALPLLLRLAVAGRGVWPNSDMFTSAFARANPGNVYFRPNRHIYMRANTDDVTDQEQKQLDSSLLLASIKRFLLHSKDTV